MPLVVGERVFPRRAPHSSTHCVIHATSSSKIVQGMNNAAALVAIRVGSVLSKSGEWSGLSGISRNNEVQLARDGHDSSRGGGLTNFAI